MDLKTKWLIHIERKQTNLKLDLKPKKYTLDIKQSSLGFKLGIEDFPGFLDVDYFKEITSQALSFLSNVLFPKSRVPE